MEKHGKKHTSEYKIWENIIQRCTNERCPAFARYGAKGIRLCDEWRKSFQAFYDHIGVRPSPLHTVDRIDGRKGYEPGNVRWATHREQVLNRDKTIWLEVDGRRQCLKDWMDETGLAFDTLKKRIKLGWTDEQIIKTPPRTGVEFRKRVPAEVGNAAVQYRIQTGISYRRIAEKFGVSPGFISGLVKKQALQLEQS